MVGKPVVKGTRIPVALVLEYLSRQPSFDELFADYPSLTLEDVQACFAYAQRLVDKAWRGKSAAALSGGRNSKE
jgi:uncharacterized protein (DUF433 family)